jgi:hypothetical protein
MGIEDEANKDISLTDEEADSVSGATKKVAERAAHHADAASPAATSPAATLGKTPGLGMGPDPSYPNPDGGADDLDT